MGPQQQQICPPQPKRKKRDTESSDEGISLGYDEVQIEELKKEVIELRLQVDRERKLRQSLEDRMAAGPKNVAGKPAIEPAIEPTEQQKVSMSNVLIIPR